MVELFANSIRKTHTLYSKASSPVLIWSHSFTLICLKKEEKYICCKCNKTVIMTFAKHEIKVILSPLHVMISLIVAILILFGAHQQNV